MTEMNQSKNHEWGAECEKIFREDVSARGATCKKITETNSAKTSDFFIQTSGIDFTSEVTHIEPTEYIANEVYNRTIGRKLKSIISSKQKQIKSTQKRFQLPTVLTIYDLNWLPSTSHEDIVSIYGDRTLLINRITGKVERDFCGKNVKLNSDRNTSLSALCVARFISAQEVFYTIYHNPFAKIPFQNFRFSEAFGFEEKIHRNLL